MALPGIPRLRGIIRAGEELYPLVYNPPGRLLPVTSNFGNHQGRGAGRGTTRGKGGPGGGGEPAGVVSAARQVLSNPGTGQQTITIDELGWTPKLAIILSGGTSDLDTTNNSAAFFFGVAAVSGQWSQGFSSDHNSGTVNSRYIKSQTHCFIQPSGALGIARAAQFVEFVPNGVKIDWIVNPAATYITVVLVGGAGLANVSVGVTPLANAAAKTVTVGHPTNALITSSRGVFDANGYDGSRINLGYGAYNGTTHYQSCFDLWETDGSSVSNFKIETSATKIDANVLDTEEVTFGNVTATGFDLTSITDMSSDSLAYCALELTTEKAWAGVLDTPISTASDWSITNPGFQPVLALLTTTFAQALGPITAFPHTQASGNGVAAITAADTSSYNYSARELSGFTDCSRRSSSKLESANDAGAVVVAGDLNVFTGTGAEIALTATYTSPLKWPALFLG